MGLTVDPTTIQVKNTAAVMVTATLPPFAQPGSRIDVTIAAMGDAPSLAGRHFADDRAEGRRRPGLRRGAGSYRFGRIYGRPGQPTARPSTIPRFPAFPMAGLWSAELLR
jgi:hypothetical protein